MTDDLVMHRETVKIEGDRNLYSYRFSVEVENVDKTNKSETTHTAGKDDPQVTSEQ